MPLPKETFKRFRTKLRQLEATTGRRISPQVTESLFRAELGTQAERATEERRLTLAESRFAETSRLERERLKRESGAAKVRGAVSLAQLGIAGADTFGKLRQPPTPGIAPAPEPLTPTTAGIGAAGVVTGAALPTAEAGLIGTATTEGLGATAGLLPTTAAGVGLPVATGVPATATGILPAAPAAITPTAAAPGLGATLGAGATVAGVAGLGAAAGGMVFGGEEGVIGAGRTTQQAGQVLGGTAAGAAYGSVVPGIGTAIGAVIGTAVGGISALFGGDEDGKVICTELNRQGYISDEVLDLDIRHRQQYIGETAQKGYLKWATPLVKLMKKSWLVTQLVRPFGCAWANEMASRMNCRYKGNLLGKAIIKVGLPLCSFIGRRCK